VMPTLAENIKLYRKRARLTQKELASKLGVAPTAVSAWELGRNKPLMDNIESMALLFDIKKSVLLGEDLVVLSTTTAPNSLIEQVSEKMVQLTEPNQKNVLRYSSELLDKQNTVTDSKNTVSELQATYHTYNYYDQPASAGTGQYLNDV
uniref:helix-turn-helix transcriptional regulator n=1 Tax=Streptococcus suis TaxID=1307 RepID=UPI002ED486E3